MLYACKFDVNEKTNTNNNHHLCSCAHDLMVWEFVCSPKCWRYHLKLPSLYVSVYEQNNTFIPSGVRVICVLCVISCLHSAVRFLFNHFSRTALKYCMYQSQLFLFSIAVPSLRQSFKIFPEEFGKKRTAKTATSGMASRSATTKTTRVLPSFYYCYA